MNRAAVYLYRAARDFGRWQADVPDARDGLVLIVGGLAAIGVLVIALVWGLPA